MALCRVYSKPDGTVAVLHPNYRLKMPTETEQQFLDRICAKDAPNSGLDRLPFRDLDKAQLPARADRARWTVNADRVQVRQRP